MEPFWNSRTEVNPQEDHTGMFSADESSADRDTKVLEAVLKGAKNYHLVYLDRDFNFVRVNETYARTCGYTPMAMVGKNHFDLYPHVENEAIFRQVRDTGTAVEFKDKPFSFPDKPERGTTYWDWTLTPDTDDNGNVVGLVFALFESTDRVKAVEALRESEERLRLAWQATRDVIWDWDVENDSQRWSVTGAQVFGWTDAVNSPQTAAWWAERVYPEDRQRVSDGFHAALKDPGRTQWEDEYRFVRRDGSVAHVLDRGFILRDTDGKPRRMIGAMQDITERKSAEAKLLEAKGNLENAVRERTAQLVAANTELMQSARQLRALAGELSTTEQRERKRLAKILHDGLQQHLVAAKLQVGGLVHPANAPGMNETVTLVEEILDDALKVSRTLAAELSPPILHDSGLLAGLEWLARRMLDRHGLKVEVQAEQPDIPRLADDVNAFLFEAVRELLLNVVKHANTKNAWILLSPEGENIRVHVSDDGTGFDATRKPAGAEDAGGFGLFSIRERIKLLGGKFELNSRAGGGSSFALVAPLCTPSDDVDAATLEERQSVTSLMRHADAGKIRVMLADDHAVMREGLARLLAQEKDFEVVGQASDGYQAIRMAAYLLPDVLLMDISMPGMSGIEATRIIHQQHPRIRIIGLSLYTAAERSDEMLEAGAADYLSKSGPPADLKKAIRSCVKARVAFEPPEKPYSQPTPN